MLTAHCRNQTLDNTIDICLFSNDDDKSAGAKIVAQKDPDLVIPDSDQNQSIYCKTDTGNWITLKCLRKCGEQIANQSHVFWLFKGLSD